MTRFGCLLLLACVACSSRDPEEDKRKREDERAAFLDGLTHLCDPENPVQAPQLAAYRRGAQRHGVAAVQRDEKTWFAVGSPHPAGAATPEDPQQIEAVACIDRTWLHEVDQCQFDDEHGYPSVRFQTGREIVKIRFVEPKTGNVLVETKLESTTEPRPCPTAWTKGDNSSAFVTRVKEADIDAVLERFRSGALVPGTT